MNTVGMSLIVRATTPYSTPIESNYVMLYDMICNSIQLQDMYSMCSPCSVRIARHEKGQQVVEIFPYQFCGPDHS